MAILKIVTVNPPLFSGSIVVGTIVANTHKLHSASLRAITQDKGKFIQSLVYNQDMKER